MIRLWHRDQRARGLRLCPVAMEHPALPAQFRQFPRAIGNGDRLLHHGPADRRMRRDFGGRQMQLVVQIGLGNRGQFINAGHGQRAHHQGMLRRQRRQMPARRPPGSNNLPCHTMRRAMRAKPIQRGVDFTHDARHGSLRRQRIAANPNRPSGGQGAFGHDGEILPPIALPIAAMDEHQTRRIGTRGGVEIPLFPRTTTKRQIKMPGMGGAKRLRQRIAIGNLRRAIGHAIEVVISRIARGLGPAGPTFGERVGACHGLITPIGAPAAKALMAATVTS